MTTPKIWDAKHPRESLCSKSGWRLSMMRPALWQRSSLLVSTCLILAAAAPLAMAQSSDDDYVAPPAGASDEIAEPAAAAPAEAGPAAAAAPAAAVAAPAAAPTQDLGRMEVTGSAIARTDAETAVPVTIIEAEEMRQQGITSTAQLLRKFRPTTRATGLGLVQARPLPAEPVSPTCAVSARTRHWCC